MVAALKVRYVLLDFMELRTAPRGARIAFEVWTVAIAVVILGFHFVPG